MKKIKVVFDFLRYPVPGKIEFGKNTVAKTTGNSYFATPDVPLASVTSAIGVLEADYTSAQSGNHAYVAKMHQSEKALDALLHKLAAYVDRIADGNDSIILSSGFHISKQPEKKSVSNFKIANGENHGELVLSIKRVVGAKSYIWQQCIGSLPATDADWKYINATTQVKHKVTGLESGTKMWFRVVAITAKATIVCCEPTMKIVP